MEISSYTDYYRLRASRSATASLPTRARHYDFPSPHAPGGVVPPDLVFDALGCNGGQVGRAEPAALAPCGTQSIADVCGNFGGWQPFDAAESARRCGTVDDYAARYAERYDALATQGFALMSERDRAIELARRAFSSAD